MKKEEYLILGLLGIGVIIVLIYLWKQAPASAPVTTTVPSPGAEAAPAYPISKPIQLGNIRIAGSPTNLTYNQIPPGPTVGIGPDNQCPCSASDCDEAGMLTSATSVDPDVFSAAVANFASYQAKLKAA